MLKLCTVFGLMSDDDFANSVMKICYCTYVSIREKVKLPFKKHILRHIII
jgi:hypothetical protein